MLYPPLSFPLVTERLASGVRKKKLTLTQIPALPLASFVDTAGSLTSVSFSAVIYKIRVTAASQSYHMDEVWAHCVCLACSLECTDLKMSPGFGSTAFSISSNKTSIAELACPSRGPSLPVFLRVLTFLLPPRTNAYTQPCPPRSKWDSEAKPVTLQNSQSEDRCRKMGLTCGQGSDQGVFWAVETWIFSLRTRKTHGEFSRGKEP